MEDFIMDSQCPKGDISSGIELPTKLECSRMDGLREFPMWNKQHCSWGACKSSILVVPWWTPRQLLFPGCFATEKRMWFKESPSLLSMGLLDSPPQVAINPPPPGSAWPMDKPSKNGRLCKSLLPRGIANYIICQNALHKGWPRVPSPFITSLETGISRN